MSAPEEESIPETATPSQASVEDLHGLADTLLKEFGKSIHRYSPDDGGIEKHVFSPEAVAAADYPPGVMMWLEQEIVYTLEAKDEPTRLSFYTRVPKLSRSALRRVSMLQHADGRITLEQPRFGRMEKTLVPGSPEDERMPSFVSVAAMRAYTAQKALNAIFTQDQCSKLTRLVRYEHELLGARADG